MSGYRMQFIRLRSRTDGEWLVAPELKSMLVDDAEEQGTNLTEVCTQILAVRFRVPVEASTRKASPSPEGTEFNLRLPDKLYRAIALASIRNRSTVPREIMYALSEHYGLEMPVGRRRRPARAAA